MTAQQDADRAESAPQRGAEVRHGVTEVGTAVPSLDADQAAAEALAGWETRLRAAVEQTLRRRRARAAQHADHTERRAYGLAERHRRKLARNNPPTTREDHQR